MNAPTNNTITRTVIITERTSELGWLLCSFGTCVSAIQSLVSVAHRREHCCCRRPSRRKMTP